VSLLPVVIRYSDLSGSDTSPPKKVNQIFKCGIAFTGSYNLATFHT